MPPLVRMYWPICGISVDLRLDVARELLVDLLEVGADRLEDLRQGERRFFHSGFSSKLYHGLNKRVKVGGRALGQVARRRAGACPPGRPRRVPRTPARFASRGRAPARETGCRFRPAADRAARGGPSRAAARPSETSRSRRARRRSRAPAPRRRAASFPVKQCRTPRTSPPPSSRRIAMRVLVGLPRVDDDRALELAREPDLRAEHRVLHVARRKVVVVVEADLADRTRRRRRGELLPDDGRPPARDRRRTGAPGAGGRRSRTAPRARARRRARPAPLPSRCRPRGSPVRARRPPPLRAAITCVEIGGERLVCEMTVAVDHSGPGSRA